MFRLRKPTLCELCLDPAVPSSRLCRQHQGYAVTASADTFSDVEPRAPADQPTAAREHHRARRPLMSGLLVVLAISVLMAITATVWWVWVL
jgi:hypothetical protein